MNKSKLRQDASALVQGRTVYQVTFSDRTVEMRELRILTKPMGLKGLGRLHHRMTEGELDRTYLKDMMIGYNRVDPLWLLISWTREWYVRLGEGYTYTSRIEGEAMEPTIDIAVTVDDVYGTTRGVRSMSDMWAAKRFGTQVFFSRRRAMAYFKSLIPQLRRPRPRPANHRSEFYEWKQFDKQSSDTLFYNVTYMRDVVCQTFVLPEHLLLEGERQ